MKQGRVCIYIWYCALGNHILTTKCTFINLISTHFFGPISKQTFPCSFEVDIGSELKIMPCTCLIGVEVCAGQSIFVRAVWEELSNQT